MSTCVHCGKRKGKRTCPALDGAICPSCCGKHRLQEIDCPSSCVHLGALSIVRAPGHGDAAFTNADYDAMFALLEDHARGMADLGRAALRRIYAGNFGPSDWEAPVGMAYLYYGHRDPTGRRMIDHFIAMRGRGLRPTEVAAAVALQRAWASLFEIASIQMGVGLVLRDLLSGESITIREVSATSQLKPRDVLFTWVIAFPDHLELTGAGCRVPRPHLDGVRAALDAELERARRERPGIPDRELVGSLAWTVIATLLAAFRERWPLELEDALAEQLRHRAGAVRDPEAAMGEARELSLAERDALPAAIQREIVRQYLRDHYERWLDTALPALDGATPRDAARTPAGRAQVDELLAEIEHGTARMDGGEAVDFAAMRRELGLAGPAGLGEELPYDAAQRPDPARWLTLDDQAKARAVEVHHRGLTAHPEVKDPHPHAMMHVIVENQLAQGEPPEARAALERLIGAGLSRHAAVHAVGSVVAEALWKVLREQAAFDRGASARALDRLRPEGWAF